MSYSFWESLITIQSAWLGIYPFIFLESEAGSAVCPYVPEVILWWWDLERLCKLTGEAEPELHMGVV